MNRTLEEAMELARDFSTDTDKCIYVLKHNQTKDGNYKYDWYEEDTYYYNFLTEECGAEIISVFSNGQQINYYK